ncbi:MAG TPA: NUDIX hydrolase [Flavipsychrobacter sp.]|nr:NUDIX hydrolase [Flavipsychrobacter sp.]
MQGKELLEHCKRLKTIADTGILYSTNEYDQERYTELRAMSLELLSMIGGHRVEELNAAFLLVTDHPTAKVDVRGVVLSDDKRILLVRESIDGRWSLPGGWAEIGHSPMETVINECKEETGLDVQVEKLLAVFDKRKHPHTPQATYVYKMVFYCTATSHEIQKGFDVLDVQYFPIDNLPALSQNRILESQIKMVYEKIIKQAWEAYFD